MGWLVAVTWNGHWRSIHGQETATLEEAEARAAKLTSYLNRTMEERRSRHSYQNAAVEIMQIVQVHEVPFLKRTAKCHSTSAASTRKPSSAPS